MTSPNDVAAAVEGKGSSPVRLVKGVGAKVYEQLPGGKDTPVREAVEVLRAAADGQRPSPKLNLLERFLEEVGDLIYACALQGGAHTHTHTHTNTHTTPPPTPTR